MTTMPTTNTPEIRYSQSELRAAPEGRTITGYAAKFNSWSDPIMGWFKEQIDSRAFEGTDMNDVIMCFNHSIDNILARSSSGTLRLSVDNVGLRFEFEVPNTTAGNDMLELVRRGDISKCSFKFRVDSDEWRYADKENGLEFDERTILHISKLHDVSLVVHPAYKDTEASIRELEERKAEYIKQHSDEDNTTENQTGVEVDEVPHSAADRNLDQTQTECVDSECRKRTVEFLNLKNR